MLDGKMGEFKVPAQQADATLSQAPASGTKYTILETKNIRLDLITVNTTWTVQPDPLQVWLTLDGQEYRFDQANPVSTQNYIPVVYPQLAPAGPHAMRVTVGNFNDDFSVFPFGKTYRVVKVEAEITGGTVSNLAGRVIYAKW